jgi:predicted AAA+ superfamily ATPase
MTYARRQYEHVKQALASYRVVVLSGARQTGKTTLARQAAEGAGDYRSLDDTNMLDFALADPKGFVMNKAGVMVIDEIQKAPRLIPEIKLAVDRDTRPGQYLLTGSANILTLPAVSDSMAGRARYLRLRPLTVGETLGNAPRFLERAFEGDFPAVIGGYDKADIIALALRGGFPEAVAIGDARRRKEWHADYLRAIIERDLRDVANIRRYGALWDLVGILASWSSKYMEASQITSALSVNKVTLDSYINALMAMYIFEKVPPWLKTDYERIGKKAKLYAADTGLMASVLGWNPDGVYTDNDRSGKLVETFVFQELSAQTDLGNRYNLYQYRDRNGMEIDFLAERGDGALLGVEVKAGHSVSASDFKAQRWFADNILRGEGRYTGVVLYSGDRTIQFGGNMFAVPTAALWV